MDLRELLRETRCVYISTHTLLLFEYLELDCKSILSFYHVRTRYAYKSRLLGITQNHTMKWPYYTYNINTVVCVLCILSH